MRPTGQHGVGRLSVDPTYLDEKKMMMVHNLSGAARSSRFQNVKFLRGHSDLNLSFAFSLSTAIQSVKFGMKLSYSSEY